MKMNIKQQISHKLRMRQCNDRCEAKQLHLLLSENQCDRQNTVLGNLLVKMYGDCGMLEDAWQAFKNIEKRNVFSWNIMLTANARCGDFLLATNMFKQYPSRDVVSWNTMITLYSRLKDLQKIQEHFNQMPERDVSSWNSIVTANAQNGHLHTAINLANRMPSVQVVTWNAILSAYAGNGEVEKARDVFNFMAERDCASWNAMVTAYAENGHLQDAENMLKLMSEQSQVSWNAVITGYSSSGNLDTAKVLFESAPERNGITWSTLISGYAQHGQSKRALHLFKTMDLEGVKGDNVTLVSVLYACASVQAAVEGRILYTVIEENGLLQDVPLANNLMNMFARCGSLESARRVFDRMSLRDPLSWNTLITAYSKAGEVAATFELYHTMILVGIQPVNVTFVSILSSCSHAGLLKNSAQHFHSMSEDFDIAPGYHHYRCMIDVLGRVGQLDRAEELINTMPYKADAVLWNTLLSACKNHSDLDQAARVGSQVIQLDPRVRSSYVLLSNAIVQDHKFQSFIGAAG